MSMQKQLDEGMISISNDAIASLTGLAVSQCYGVVGMASKNFFKDGIAELLGSENLSKGIVVKKTDNGLELDVYIIICYGVKINQVALEVQKRVKYELANGLDIDFAAVNVFVQGVKAIN